MKMGTFLIRTPKSVSVKSLQDIVWTFENDPASAILYPDLLTFIWLCLTIEYQSQNHAPWVIKKSHWI